MPNQPPDAPARPDNSPGGDDDDDGPIPVGDAAVLLLAPDWRVRSAHAVGPRFAPLAASLPGRDLLDAHPEFAGTPLHAALVHALTARAPATLEGYYPPLAARVAVRADPSPDGGLTIFCQDVTATRALEDDCRRLQAVADSSGDALLAVDPAGRITLWGPAAHRTLGHAPADALGRPLADLLAFESRPALQQALARALANPAPATPERVDLTHLTPDGRPLEVTATLAPVRDPAGRVTGAAVVARDVTAQRRAARLESEKDRLESDRAAKDQFLAVLSHELRTPLTPVLMAAGALEQDPALPPSVRDEIVAMRRNVELEARLIDDLLDLNRITRGKLQLDLQPADVHSLIGHALYVAREDILAKRIWLRMDLRATRHTVRADPVRLQQVFWNLLKNAVQFTPAGGTLIVRSADHEGAVRVEVQDTGVGIDPAALARIFDAFEQLPAAAAAAPPHAGPTGTLGLGLAIARALVELHGGRIWAESAGAGRGATFVVELPASTPAPAVPADAPPPAPGPAPAAPAADLAHRLAILVVEDHAATAQMLQKVLTGLGHDVATAASLGQAAAATAARRFDLLISDLGLPDGSGLDLMRRLRTDAPGVRGIALTGYGMDDDRRRTADAGFAAHLTKPVALHELKSVIDRVTRGVLPAAAAASTPRPHGAPRD